MRACAVLLGFIRVHEFSIALEDANKATINVTVVLLDEKTTAKRAFQYTSVNDLELSISGDSDHQLTNTDCRSGKHHLRLQRVHVRHLH